MRMRRLTAERVTLRVSCAREGDEHVENGEPCPGFSVELAVPKFYNNKELQLRRMERALYEMENGSSILIQQLSTSGKSGM